MAGLDPIIDNNSSNAQVAKSSGQSAGAFAASLVVAIVIFAVEAGLFVLIKDRLSRIYQPRTYLVPERERTTATAPGWFKWIRSVLSTSNTEFLEKCGLDAYFFLRYLRTLLKIFIPAACVILPILIPLNAINGKGTGYVEGNSPDEVATNVTGLDQLAWGNVRPTNTNRFWAHWVLALAFITYICFVIFDELRGYIRMRQAYLTSPTHRMRASATTVLVSAIPRKWCTVEALDGLYDVFPGGIRNIWLNRNFDELSDKIKQRDNLASKLETAETDLVKKCVKAEEKRIAAEAKKTKGTMSKEQKQRQDAVKEEKGTQNAQGHGLSSGNPHQVQHTVQDAMDGVYESNSDSESVSSQSSHRKHAIPIPVIGEGIQAVSDGIGRIGKGVLGGFRKADKDLNEKIDTTNGFVAEKPRHDSAAHSAGAHHIERQLDGADSHNVGSSHTTPVRRSNTAPVRPPAPEPEEKQPPRGFFAKVKAALGFGGDDSESVEYPSAFNEDRAEDDEEAEWRKYIKVKDRDTMRLPIFGWQWMFSIPLIGKKVDTIYHCRKEVARLNLEIEEDQANPERFPLMNSAFIQFNHQVAAHMACQSVSHHLPKQMAPRLVEIDPQDVIWDNMSIPWWQGYFRTTGVLTIIVAMIVLWAIPVAFTSALSQLSTLAQTLTFLRFLLNAPTWFISALQGVLPALFLAILMAVLPLLLRFLAKIQGLQSGMLVELSVQRYYFFFLFVQIFLVVSVAAAASTLIDLFKTGPSSITSVPSLLAQNVPRASNYFFSYMLLQALSVSAGALVQVGSLISWFILAPILDSTARSKFRRQTALNEVRWGTFFPVYTNLACIGIIYSVISPLILVFNIITFSLFWFVYRYNTLYVTKFSRDTGGLLFPIALNTTFVGVYVLEILLIGMFFLVRDDQDNVACSGQGIGMIVILILTAAYQILLNEAFSPLFRYLPITLEDDAVQRDEEFARALNRKQTRLDDEREQDLQDELERRERQSREEDREAEEYELQKIREERHSRHHGSPAPLQLQNPEVTLDPDRRSKAMVALSKTGHAANNAMHKLPIPSSDHRRSSWADRSRNHRSSQFGKQLSPSPHPQPRSPTHHAEHKKHKSKSSGPPNPSNVLNTLNNMNPLLGNASDMEAQRAARSQLADALFAGIHDELQDLTPEQRDVLVQRAFQHTAMRARRPVIWIPRDDLGVSDDEVRRTAAFSGHVWISNVRQGLDAKGRCVYSGAPPDFSEVDLIQL